MQPIARHLHHLFLLAAIALAIGGCSTNPVSGEQDFVLMSEDQEIALGRRYHQEVLKSYTPYDNPELQRYVQEVGDRVATVSHRNNLVYRFTLLDSTEVNAFALPGGYIYITRGLLAYLNSEAELAAVLGHEVGHVTARHSVRQHSASTATGLLGSIIAARAGVTGARDLTNIVGTALVRGYGREHELESDRLGAEYLARSGYDPQAMMRVVRVLKDQELFETERAREEGRKPRIYHGLFASHPDNDQRLKTVIEAAEQYRANGYRDEHDTFLRRLEGVTFGQGEDQGVVRDNHFYHLKLDMGLTFPSGWRIENRADALIAQADDNGGWIELRMTDINRRIEPREFIIRRLRHTQLSHGEPIDHDGLQGYTAITRLHTPFGAREGRVTVLYYNRHAYIFRSAARDTKHPYLHDRLALDTVRSFHPLRRDERELARPQRLQVRAAHAGEHFADLARQSPIANHAEAQLRLLNARYPDGEPRSGELIKLVH